MDNSRKTASLNLLPLYIFQIEYFRDNIKVKYYWYYLIWMLAVMVFIGVRASKSNFDVYCLSKWIYKLCQGQDDS